MKGRGVLDRLVQPIPVVQPSSKVLVSGADGYIATWVIRNLLEHGYSVRGTVCSARQGEHAKKYFANYGGKLEIVIIKDITREGAFDEAVQGVDAIIHIASPVYSPEDMVAIAVKGTLGILRSALQFGQNIKRIVYTSSAAAILREVNQPTIFTEEDWNFHVVNQLKEQGKNPSAAVKYRASKTLAEQGWSSCTPPAIQEVTDPTSLNFSARLFYDHVADSEKSEAVKQSLSTSTFTWVDVRDVAEAHRRALERQEAGGPWRWQDFTNLLDPPPQLSRPLPKGNPGVGSQRPCRYDFDNTKSQRVLGMKYRSMAEMTRDTFADYEARGW
ncbi:D-lactaldehyde dehydrogenase [Pisolithus marmoratus]|nr:D-lactaldehyde dehydrogenase [Pisolithus marmoratus]